MPANSANARKARAARRRFRKTRTDEYEMSHFFDRGVRRGKPTSAAERRKRRRSWGNPALKPVRKSTGWLNGPAGTNTQIKFKKNPGGRTEVYIRRKARPAATAIKKNRTYRFRRAGKVGGRQRPSRPLGPPPPGTRWTSSADENAKWLRKHPEYKNPMSKRKTSTRKRR